MNNPFLTEEDDSIYETIPPGVDSFDDDEPEVLEAETSEDSLSFDPVSSVPSQPIIQEEPSAEIQPSIQPESEPVSAGTIQTQGAAEPEDTADTETSPSDTEASGEELADPDAITLLGPKFLELGDYETSVAKLKEVYEGNQWKDKQKAADAYAGVADKINKYYDVKKDVELDSESSSVLAVKLTDKNLDEETKIDLIEDWRTTQKEKLYSKDASGLLNAKETENIIDLYATQLRRSVVAKDIGRFKDSVVRAVEATVSPMAAVPDLVFGTELEDDVHELAADNTNPELDETFLAKLSSGAGSVAGFAIPGGVLGKGARIAGAAAKTANIIEGTSAMGYLGATLVQQGKQVYDEAFKESGSHEAAKAALLESSPGIALGTFGDRLIGSSLGAIMKGEKGFVGALTGAATEAAAESAQSAITGSALASALGDPNKMPTAKQLAEEALIGGILGGAVGGVADVSNYANRRQAKAEIEKALKGTEEAPEIEKARKQFEEASGVVMHPDAPATPSFMGQFIKDETAPADNTSMPPDTNPDTTVEASLDSLGDSLLTPQDKTESPSGAIFDAVGVREGQAAFPEKLLPVADGVSGQIPMPFMQELIRALDGSLSLGNAIKDQSAWGFYNSNDHSITIERKIFKNLDQAYNTFAHEIGHMVDYYGRGQDVQAQIETSPEARSEPLINKLVRLNNVLRGTFDNEAILAEGRALSAQWRPGWNGQDIPAEWKTNPPPERSRDRQMYDLIEYRNRTTEIQADSFSAIMNDPQMVQAQFPKLWEAFTKGLDTQPNVKAFYMNALEIATNPEKLKEWSEEKRAQNRLKQAEIAGAHAAKAIAESPTLMGWVKDVGKDTKRRIFARFGVAEDIAAKQKGDIREDAYKAVNDLHASLGTQNQINLKFEGPILNLITRDWPALGIESVNGDPLGSWKNYEYWNRIINETTQTIDAIKAEPETYHRAYRKLYNTLQTLADKKAITYNPLNKIGEDISAFRDMDLADELAKANQVFVDLLPKQIRNKLLDQMISEGDMEAASLLTDDSFNVRRYLGNPDADVRTATSNMDVLRNQLGEEKFKGLEKISKQFHSIITDGMLKSVKDSGLLTPALVDRIERNRDNWINFNVLKYFQDNAYFSGVIKGQIGTISEVGDELASSTLKSEAVFSLSEFQKTQNAAVNIARMGGYETKAIEPEYELKKNFKIGRKSIFQTQKEMQSQNPDKSFIIQYEDGVPTLYQIDSPDFAKMFEQSFLEQAKFTSGAMRLIEGYNKALAERELKTVLSLPFVWRQVFHDRTKEAMIAKSLLPRLGLPFHTSPYLAKIDRQGDKDARDVLNLVFNEDTQLLIDTNTLAPHYVMGEGGDLSTNVADTVYKLLGKPVPGEDKLSVPVKMNKGINKALEILSLGQIKKVKQKAEKDETRAKINIYRIARDKGMGKQEAAAFARRFGGTPDPLAGGTEAASLSKIFLFGRAHFNGMRAQYELFKHDPKGQSFQYVYRKMIPRLLVSSAIMGPLIGALFGEEEENLYRKFLDKIPTFDKETKLIIPWGFRDGNGEFKGFDAKAEEIGSDWKSVYLRLPYAHEMINFEQISGIPIRALEEIAETGDYSLTKLGQSIKKSMSTVFGGSFAPGIMASTRMTQFLAGENPQDYFRRKGVISKDVQAAGDFFERTYEYMAWSLYNWNPAVFAFQGNKVSSLDASQSPMDDLAEIPAIGPTVKAFIGESNYGDFEKGNEAVERKGERDASIRLGMGTESKRLYNEYVKAHSMVTKLGKGWQEKVPPSEVNRVHQLNNWHARAYKQAFNEARAYWESGESEYLKEVYKNLEESSSSYLETLQR